MAKNKIPAGASPVSGSSLWNILRLIRKNRIDRPYIVKFIITLIVAAILEPFRIFEQIKYNGRIRRYKIKKDPVFILGHWRSGTTFLHNVLCQDPSAAYVTTYQTVYPEMLFSGRKVIKTTMQAIMPKKRPFDNMDLGTDLPQEEEFALTNTNALGQSNFWHFPKRWREYNKTLITFEGVSNRLIRRWKRGYMRIIKKAMLNTGGERFISKNPPNTGRIKVLLEMFPNARFIHIYRNPVTTYLSTTHFVNTLMPTLTFQNISKEEMDRNILWQYKNLMQQYEKERSLIPPENLVELRYEDFEKDPISEVNHIYKKLRLPGYERILPMLKEYLESKRSYKKNSYPVKEEIIQKVTEHWGFAIEKYGY